MDLKNWIRDIPDFPKPGIVFKDITPLLRDPAAFQEVVSCMARPLAERDFDAVVAIEARGFLFGSALAYRLGKPLVPVRKLGKLPFETHSVTYALEYGEDTMEMHTDGLSPGQRVIIVDDVLATGGTLAAASQLVQKAGGAVEGISLVAELTFLNGRQALGGHDIFSLIKF